MGSLCLIIFIISLLNESFGSLVLSFLRVYSSPIYFALYGPRKSTLLAAAKIVGPTASKKAVAVAIKGGEQLIMGGGIIIAADHIGKSIKLDQVVSKGAVELLNTVLVPNHIPTPLDPNLPPTSSFLESTINPLKNRS